MEVLPARNEHGQQRKGGPTLNPRGRAGGPRKRLERQFAYQLERAAEERDGVAKLADAMWDEALADPTCNAAFFLADRFVPRNPEPDEHENRADLELAERASEDLIAEFASRAREALPSGRAILDIAAEPDPRGAA